MSQSRNYLFTLNNPTSPLSLPEGARYMVYQREKAPTTGTEHFQGYVCFDKKMTLTGCNKLFKAHWEARKGSHSQAVDYCTKEASRLDGPWHLGQDLAPGTRTDLESVAQEILAGKSLKRVAEDSPALFAKHHKGLQALRLATLQPRSGVKPQVLVIAGPSGIGKSRYVMDKWPDCYRKDSATKWWDGYDGQEVVFFDEFYGGIPYNDMLQVVDWHAKQVETKGGHVQLVAHTFIFASNKHWDDWYSGVEDRSAFQRRLNEWGTLVWATTTKELNNISFQQPLNEGSRESSRIEDGNTQQTTTPAPKFNLPTFNPLYDMQTEAVKRVMELRKL